MPPQSDMPALFVADGSNLATEGRDMPSLAHLNEALAAFREEYPGIKLTVVADATFGHRIAKKEVAAFDQAVANNEIVTPPAGAIGRGDAFILAIADKANAGVLSNDSFQEFHGEYGWLFEHGRLIGGKPVPHVGWVFVDRNPVRGPKSRASVKAAKSSTAGSPTDAKEQANRRVSKKSAARKKKAAEPAADTTEATTAEPAEQPAASEGTRSEGRRRRRGGRGRGSKSETPDTSSDESSATPPASSSGSHVNELVPFLDFVERHPVGTEVRGTVDSYSSHGAYARVDEVLVYIPLRLMSDPAPSSARKVLATGDEVVAVVAGFVPDRRSIDAALPAMSDRIDKPEGAGVDEPAPAKAPTKRPAARKRAAKKAPATKAAARTTAAGKTTAKKAAPAKKAAAKRTPAKKTPAKTAPAKRAAAKAGAAKKAPAKKAAAKKTAAKRTPAKKTAAKRTTAKRAAKKSAATTRRRSSS